MTPLDTSIDDLVDLLAEQSVVVLTGAGCSTESGIPDYRGAGRPQRSPIQHDAFMRRPEVRQRYWARATIGWERFRLAQPNAAHRALADMEQSGHMGGIITQNVDRLHQAAGSQRVIELHGALAEVRCLDCQAREPRDQLQTRLLSANPHWREHAAMVAPDGDADLPSESVGTFHVVSCAKCGGTLMPDVVFFGGTVPQTKVDDAWSLVYNADVLLVVGSSLAVYSGWRFVRGAAERGIPVAIVNVGPTRADELGRLKIAAPAGEVLPRVMQALG